MYRSVNLEVERASEEAGGGPHDRLEILCAQAFEVLMVDEFRGAGVVHERVDTAVLRQHFFRYAAAVRVLRHIALDRDGIAALLGNVLGLF